MGVQRALAVLGALLGSSLSWLPVARRAHVVAAMRRAGVDRPERRASGMYRALGFGLCELLLLLVVPALRLSRFVRFDEPVLQRLRDVRRAGRGVVIATAHTANWDLVACAAADHVPLTVATKRLSIRWLDAIWQRLRGKHGIHLITSGGVAASALKSLGQGGAVALMIDQAPERRRAVIATPFLGRVAWVDLSPALIAARARAPFVVLAPWRRRDGSLGAAWLLELSPPATPSRAWAVDAMRTATAALERFVLDHPEQWLWLHRRWKDLPQEQNNPAGEPAHG